MWPFTAPTEYVSHTFLGTAMRGKHPTHEWVVRWRRGSKQWSTLWAKHAGINLQPPNDAAMAQTFRAMAATMKP